MSNAKTKNAPSKGMTDDQVKSLLLTMMETHTPGRILGLLSDIFKDSHADAVDDGDEDAAREFKAIQETLETVGVGIDARFPQ